MTSQTADRARLTVAATFPEHFFLENLVMRADGSILVTVLNRKELWYVPPVTAGLPVEPRLMHGFGEPPLGVVESAEPDVFLLCTSNIYTSHESHLHRLDLRSWQQGARVTPQTSLAFPKSAGGLNGACLVAPTVLLVGDSLAGLIWRVDLHREGEAELRVWLKHASMDYVPGEKKPEQPGVNGVRFAERSGYLYYTATATQVFMRVKVDPATQHPTSEPELVADGHQYDDFCIDEEAGVAYVTTHRENSIERIPLEPGVAGRGFVAGVPFDRLLVGPSSGVWGRGLGETGRIAYFITDGGTTAPPPDGLVRPARLLPVEFA
jgi:hypothetical protein